MNNEFNFFLDESEDLDWLRKVDDELPWQFIKGDLFDILVHLGVFSSKSQAKKNWKGGQIRPGFNFFERIGKKRLSIIVKQRFE